MSDFSKKLIMRSQRIHKGKKEVLDGKCENSEGEACIPTYSSKCVSSACDLIEYVETGARWEKKNT